MRGSVQIVTSFTSFAHDLRDRLVTLGYEVSLRFEAPLRCRALYAEGQALNEAQWGALWEELAPLRLTRRPQAERTPNSVIIELGGVELESRTSACQLTLEGPCVELHRRLERRLEPVGLGALQARTSHPTKAILRYGGAPHAVLAIVSWYLQKEGHQVEWARLWGLHDMALLISLPAPSSAPPNSSHEPSSWRVMIECDDQALSEELIKRLSLVGFTHITAQVKPLTEHIGTLVTWGPVEPNQLIKLALWEAVSDMERALLGPEAAYPRCELEGAALSSDEPSDPLAPTLQPSLSVRVARASIGRDEQAQRAQELSRELELCLRSERGELSEVARLLRALQPKALQIVTQGEWEELCELMTLLDERAYPADLPQLGLVWGEVRCARSLAPLGAWLRDQITLITQRRPLLVCTSALGPKELWVLLPKGS